MAESITTFNCYALKTFFAIAALSLPSSSSKKAILWSQGIELSTPITWTVFNKPTESALSIKLSISANEGNLENKLFKLRLAFALALLITVFIRPEATALLFTLFD